MLSHDRPSLRCQYGEAAIPLTQTYRITTAKYNFTVRLRLLDLLPSLVSACTVSLCLLRGDSRLSWLNRLLRRRALDADNSIFMATD